MTENTWKIMRKYKFEIDNSINNDFRCGICNELMICASSAPCGCRFCADCIENYLNGNDKFCPGKSKHCDMKMINYQKDIIFDNPVNIRISRIFVKCPMENCQFKNEISMIEDHIKKCDRRPISCPYLEFGCQANEMVKDDMENHLNTENYCHNELLVYFINNFQSEIESMKNEIIEVKKDDFIKLQLINQNHKICELEIKEREFSFIIEVLKEEMDGVKNENRSLRNEIITNVISIAEMQQMIKEIQTKSQQQIEELKQTYQCQLDEQNKKFEMMQKLTDKISEQNEHSMKVEKHNEKLELFKKQINNLPIIGLDRKLGIFAEIEWKIENLSKQKRNNRIYSKVFYSGKFGYKMCLSVAMKNLNVIRVYFHLMIGEFDDELTWPFTCSLTMFITDQKSKNVMIGKTGYCEYHTVSRPKNEINEGIWFSFNKKAVNFDDVLIKCKVE